MRAANPVASIRLYCDAQAAIALIDGAKERVRIQVLGYKAGGYKGGWWGDLDNAIRRADGRRVHVELMVSNWGTSKSKLESIKSLQVLDRVTVKVVGLPEHSSGFIPFARTIHAKIMTVDGARGWLGTSNWSRSRTARRHGDSI